MRIIAGKNRSLPLKTIPGRETRPTTDRIKETLFNIIQDEISGSYVLDLFAGSGQIGLEAISRGAAYAVFAEQDKKACACIEENIRFTKSDRETKLYCADAVSAVRRMEGIYRFDVVFMDPPYGQGLEAEALSALLAAALLKEDALVIVECPLNADLFETEVPGYEVVRIKRYKTNEHVFLRPENVQK